LFIFVEKRKLGPAM